MVLLVIIGLSSCSREESSNFALDTEEAWEVTAILSPDGLGDLAYNDLAFYGICQMRDSLGCKVSSYNPFSFEDAESRAKEWVSQQEKSNQHRLLLLCDGSYAGMVKRNGWSNSANSSILLLDGGDETLPVYTRSLLLYGACYAFGRLSADLSRSSGKNVALVLANTDDWAVNEGAAGFTEGAREENIDVDIYNVYDEKSRGYEMEDSVYHLCYDIAPSTCFVLPLAGRSSQGVYRYGRDERQDVIYSCTLDQYGTYEPSFNCFYLKRDIGKYLLDFASDWKNAGSLDLHSVEGMSGKYITYAVFSQPYGSGWTSSTEIQNTAKLKEEQRYAK